MNPIVKLSLAWMPLHSHLTRLDMMPRHVWCLAIMLLCEFDVRFSPTHLKLLVAAMKNMRDSRNPFKIVFAFLHY